MTDNEPVAVRKLRKTLKKFFEKGCREDGFHKIMIDMKKVLEDTKIGEDLPTLNLYSNWLVHPSLDRKPNLAVLERISSVLDQHGDSEDINSMLWAVADCLNLEGLRSEIIDLLASHKVDESFFKDDNQWSRFSLNLLEDLKEQPIWIKGLDNFDDENNSYEKAVGYFEERYNTVVVSLNIEDKKDKDPPPVCARLMTGVWTLRGHEPRGIFVWMNFQLPIKGTPIRKPYAGGGRSS